MSMLSAQCDELREVAYKVDEYQMGRERVPLKTAAIMREAADTIWELRNKCADLMDEHLEHERVKAENARLRELAEKAWKAAEMLCQAWDGPCHADGISSMPPCPMDERDELCVYGLIQRDLRELGVTDG